MASSSSIRVAYPQARLVSTRPTSDVVIPLDRPVFLIGSGDVAHLRLNSRQVDTVHAAVLNADGRLVLRDLLSETGVLVNGQRVEQGALHDGDEIEFGKYAFRLELGEADPLSTASVTAPAASLADAQRALRLKPPVCLIGTDARCDAQISAEVVAPKHALACAADGKWMIRGLVPANFPRRNGRSKRRWVLQQNERVGLGTAEVVFVIAPPAPAPVPAGLVTRASVTREPSEEGRERYLVAKDGGRAITEPAVVSPRAAEKPVTPVAPTSAATPAAMSAPVSSDAPQHRDAGLPRVEIASSASISQTPAATSPRALRSAEAPAKAPSSSAAPAPVEPVLADLDADADDGSSDSASSKASIDFDAIKDWGPLAMAVAGVRSRSSAAGGATSDDGTDPNEASRSARRSWLAISAGVLVLIIVAAVSWYALHGS